MTETKELIDYCTDLKYEALPDDVTKLTKHFILDSLGIAIRAIEANSSAIIIDGANAALSGGREESTVWATGEKGTAEYTSFVNGALIHTLELDDTHSEAVVHPSAPILPAAFAVAEREDADGESLLAAVVGGFEFACRLGMAVQNHEVHLERGFHGTSTCGAFGAAVASGMIADLPPNHLFNQIGITLSQSSGTLQWKENGAWNKRIQPGLAAKDAVLSLELARRGFRGAVEPLSGKYGFLTMYGVNPSAELLLEGLGETYEIRNNGIKPYACCRRNHTPIDVTLDVVRKHNLDPEEISEIILYVDESAYELSRPKERKVRPENIVDAQFSPQYAVAVAAVDRAALVSQYTKKRLVDPELRAMMDKVTVVEDESMTARHPQEWPAKIVLHSSRGTFESERPVPRGDPESRLTEEELIEKFTALTAGRLDEANRDQLIEMILDLEEYSINEVCVTIAQSVTPTSC